MILYTADYGWKEQTAECRTEEAAAIVRELYEAKYWSWRKDAHYTPTARSGQETEIG
jgi:hypothetical protein